jgi:predicted NBD/HSP70 family sugar kinase
MRELNQRAVLDRLRDFGAATRPQIAKDTGLSKPTVGQALLDLEQVKLVHTVGRSFAGQGRSAVVYEANPAAGHVLGIDIGGERIRVAVADLAGSVVAKLDERHRGRSASALVRRVRTFADRALAQAGLRMDEVVTTVVGTSGVPDQRSKTLHRAPNLPGWERKGLLGELETVLGGDVVVENDANLSAVGEHRAGAARGVDVFVSIMVGTGIGMGTIVNGSLFRGAHGAAGEVAYLPYGWPTRGLPKAGSPPRQGMLESAAAARSVVEIAVANGLTDVRTAKDVFRLAHDGDSRALKAVEEEAARLAFVIAAVAAVIDPALVVIGGGIGSTNTDLLQPPLEKALNRTIPTAPPIVTGELGEAAVLTGAIATALDTARDLVFERRGQVG